jgi:hypothetical protein
MNNYFSTVDIEKYRNKVITITTKGGGYFTGRCIGRPSGSYFELIDPNLKTTEILASEIATITI